MIYFTSVGIVSYFYFKNGVYRQLDNSYLQTSGNFYSQEYAALSPVNEV